MRVLLFLLVLSLCGPVSSMAYQPWSESVFLDVRKRFGQQAEKRYRYLHQLILDNQNLPTMKKLILVNNTMNHLPWIADAVHWKKADYWASPMETITTFGGDCEDIAIAKWIMLRHLGIPKENLRLAYVKIRKSGEAHMVLIYVDKLDLPKEQWQVLVLDNYIAEIRQGKERKDLLAVYTLDAEGTIVLFADNGKNRSVKGVFKERKVRRLDELRVKLAEEREEFKRINGGMHPLE